MKFFVRVAASVLALYSLQVWAEGDAAAGQAKSAVCSACHGADGNSMVPQWPKIAGQHETYLNRQLQLIQSGARSVPEMTGIVASLSAQDFADLSAYYAAQTTSGGVADESLLASGEELWRAGNSATGVPACMACHGPAGEGNPLAGYPALAGQHAVYTAKQLTQFRSGVNYGEKDAPSRVMNGVAAELTDAEIAALSSYIEGLYLKTE